MKPTPDELAAVCERECIELKDRLINRRAQIGIDTVTSAYKLAFARCAELMRSEVLGDCETEHMKVEAENAGLRGEIERLKRLADTWTEALKWKPYLHYCYEWDGLLIDVSDDEFDACTCFENKPKRRPNGK